MAMIDEGSPPRHNLPSLDKAVLSSTIVAAIMASPVHSLRGRATTITPEILQQMAMSNQNVKNYAIADRPSLAGVEEKDLPKSSEGRPEKFPEFSSLECEISQRKAKSMSTLNVAKLPDLVKEDRVAAINRLKTISPPLDMEQARKRRESVKEEAKEVRKASISFIRSRTTSRVEASNRPSLEDIKRSD